MKSKHEQNEQDKQDKQDEQIAHWNSIEKVGYLGSIVAILALCLFYTSVSGKAASGDPVINLLLSVIPNVVAVLLVFVVTYLFFRNIQDDRAKYQRGILAKNVALETTQALRDELEKIRSESVSEAFLRKSESHSVDRLKQLLPTAKKVRMCGWTLYRTIEANRGPLRDFVQRREYDLRILILDPKSDVVRQLDDIITDISPHSRRAQNWPPVIPMAITANDLKRTLEILEAGKITQPTNQQSVLHVCKSLLPFGMIMVECEGGVSWASVQVYTLHPDLSFSKRLTFTLTKSQTELWKLLEEQFDLAWDDPVFSQEYNPDA
ncbi:MAG TPA: hypothetical protein VGE45_20945 [Chloroflexia bacterium]|jgi:hypothetical protein